MVGVAEDGVLEIGNVDGAIVEVTFGTEGFVCGKVVGSKLETGAFVTLAVTGEIVTGEIVGAVLGIGTGSIGALDGEYDSTGDADGDDAVRGAFEIVILGTCVGNTDPAGIGSCESKVGNADVGAAVDGACEMGVLDTGVCDTGESVGTSIGPADDDGAFEVGASDIGALGIGATDGVARIVGSSDKDGAIVGLSTSTSAAGD